MTDQRRLHRPGKLNESPLPQPTAQAGWQPGWVQSLLDEGPIDVSVCIVNWNCREMLRACLESLQDQPQGVRLETIVVDNASTDGAADMVARSFPEVSLIRNSENAGFARGNNQAAQLARGRYFFFLNNDTVVPAGTLRRLVEFADRHPEAGIIGPRLRDAEGNIQVSWRARPTVPIFLHRTRLLGWTGLFRRAHRLYRRGAGEIQRPQRVEILMGAAMLMPRDVFFRAGRWDEEFVFGGEDLDLCARIGDRHPLIHLPEVEILHHGRVSTRKHLRFSSIAIPAGFVRYLRKTGTSSPALWLYKTVLTLDAPLQIGIKGLQYMWRRLRGRQEAAQRSLVAVHTHAHFLSRGLPAFWGA
jgi:GT2 family glycosyltransferase